jgi:predicted nucleic acid-binding protein
MPGEGDAGPAFVDTNIWVCAHLRAPGDARHPRAADLLSSGAGLVISPQVVGEYFNVTLRNQRTDAWIVANLQAMFTRVRLQPANAKVVSTAPALRARLRFSIRDRQIVAAALEAGCTTLFTEDLPHGQLVEKRLRVLNPLRDANA